MFKVPEKFRIKTGLLGSDESAGNNGAFRLRTNPDAFSLFCLASDGFEWEHVSVTPAAPHRCPTWAEMCYVKDVFWDTEDAVMQLHPPASQYVNNHPYCLHLWRPIGAEILLPPPILVGVIKGEQL